MIRTRTKYTAVNMAILNSADIRKVRAHDSFLKCFGKYSDFKSLDSSHLAGGLGIEPKLEASKAPVLPLDDPPILF